jgi:NADH:ubiquinone oxidoreductase subunit D
MINFDCPSPQHPAAHGVLRMILELNGEEILRADPVSSTHHLTSERFIQILLQAHWFIASWNGEADRI